MGHLLSRELVRDEMADFQVWPSEHFQYTSFPNQEPHRTALGEDSVQDAIEQLCLAGAQPNSFFHMP